ncbi:MAG: hypothetical protein HN952_04070 [Candidatus Cloacimonetes bacterium]|jgi:hypothetical protein|nr:hypothetical protein [Candidatus Cloacimonadota bacterium]MBT6994114.1 hypothetical protein [Candidatus Cloacimonadota bacterium]MBT7470351.1 hypothetical protein [Candidatus Cloacimonadota bacterium]
MKNLKFIILLCLLPILLLSSKIKIEDQIYSPTQIYQTHGASRLTRNMVGLWTFDDAENLTNATTGNNLELIGNHQVVAGPEDGDGAVNIGVDSYYECFHDIAPNGTGGANPQWVNKFTILIDFQMPSSGQWYTFFQTNYSNSNDGDAFINASGQIGVGDTGYSNYTVIPGEWYRLVISSDLGVHYDYYLDGQLLQNGGSQEFEGRFALYPNNDGNTVLFFADNDGEDNAFNIAQVALFDTDLNSTEIDALGGFGHDIPSPPQVDMNPYLQSPTPNSVYISWHSSLSDETIVEYGTTENLGQQQIGSVHTFNSETVWHTTHLTGLNANTEYFYRCITADAETPIHKFRTLPENSTNDGHIRFAVYGDTRTDYATQTMVVLAMQDKFAELYGEDYHNEVHTIFNVGDIVTSGNTLSQYIIEHFNPTISLTRNIPYMISIGNHEEEAAHFYNYMKYEDFGGDEGEKYYSYRLGKILFISLNSNTQGNTQINWLENQLEYAQNNDEIQMIFTFLHHPGHSEIWPDGNTNWVQYSVIPLLNQYDKVEQLTYGHSHNYERGALADGNLRLMLNGGGGSALDRWRMYDNQQDYAELHKSLDHYCYTIVDIDIAENSYTAKTYSLGHTDLWLDNELVDEYARKRNNPAPLLPMPISPINYASENVILIASEIESEFGLMTSQFQLVEIDENWENTIIDETRDATNIYWDTGSPNYEPINQNEGIILTELAINSDLLQIEHSYKWRARYRDKNLKWSNWSNEIAFQFVDVLMGDVDENGEVQAFDVSLVLQNVVGLIDFSEEQIIAGDVDGNGQIQAMDASLILQYVVGVINEF